MCTVELEWKRRRQCCNLLRKRHDGIWQFEDGRVELGPAILSLDTKDLVWLEKQLGASGSAVKMFVRPWAFHETRTKAILQYTTLSHCFYSKPVSFRYRITFTVSKLKLLLPMFCFSLIWFFCFIPFLFFQLSKSCKVLFSFRLFIDPSLSNRFYFSILFLCHRFALRVRKLRLLQLKYIFSVTTLAQNLLRVFIALLLLGQSLILKLYLVVL